MANSESSSTPVSWAVTEDQAGTRLDVFLAAKLPHYSRTFLRKLAATDAVLVEGQRAKVAYRLRAGQCVTFQAVDLPREGPVAENIPLDILYEDEQIAVVSKPAGMVVHPAKGHWAGTLASALAFHFERLSSAGGPTRPGIVHRLDRDTSGIMVVAKNDSAHLELARQFEQRTVRKEYWAIVRGIPDRERDMIDAPIGPHPYQREKMAIRRDHPNAREASTFYELAERFRRHSLLKVFPRSGRTHQIRLHLVHIGHPVLCDRLYGGRAELRRGEITGDAADDRIVLDRQALHARRLTFVHPSTGKTIELEAELPDDLQDLLKVLRADADPARR